jgi:hypothetical protein
MKIPLVRLMAGTALLAVIGLGSAFAQGASLALNQTLGLGNGQLLTFTYHQNYDCVDEPLDDLDFNGVLTQADLAEFQTPICQVATETSIDPAGGKIKNAAHLYVLLPMFSQDNDQNPNDALLVPPECDRRRSAAPPWAAH